MFTLFSLFSKLAGLNEMTSAWRKRRTTIANADFSHALHKKWPFLHKQLMFSTYIHLKQNSKTITRNS